VKKSSLLKRLTKSLIFRVLVTLLLVEALEQSCVLALRANSAPEALAYILLALASAIAVFVSIAPHHAKRIGKEIVRRFACWFFPSSRFARPPLSYTQARQFVAEKKSDEAIAAFQEIHRHYPDEKEPYSQIIWIANLTGQTEIAENFSRKFQERFE
jgi:hypothetical protein